MLFTSKPMNHADVTLPSTAEEKGLRLLGVAELVMHVSSYLQPNQSMSYYEMCQKRSN